MRKQLQERITRFLAPPTRALAALAALCAFTSVWAAVKPVAVWNGDFANNITRNGYTFTSGSQTVSDGKITIADNSQYAATIWGSQTDSYKVAAAVVRYSDIPDKIIISSGSTNCPSFNIAFLFSSKVKKSPLINMVYSG